LSANKHSIVIIFSGGIGLGVYQAGAYSELHRQDNLRPAWVLGSSIGSINAAVIAGNRPHDRGERLQELWRADPQAGFIFGAQPAFWRWDHLQNWASAIQTRVAGTSGQFRPKMIMPWQPFGSMYDLTPLKSRLHRLIDFDVLNFGETRFTVATTDLETGDLVLFDTGKGDKIGPDHLMASCGFIPEFAPVEIGGRLLGDGGLSANAPIEGLHLREAGDGLTCFVIDLYARDGDRPHDLESAMSRKNDLIFSNQTWQRLVAYKREVESRYQLAAASSQTKAQAVITLLYLSYRPRPEEAGAERGFDYSARMLERRFATGAADMREAIVRLEALEKDVTKPRVTLQAIRRSEAEGELRLARAG